MKKGVRGQKKPQDEDHVANVGRSKRKPNTPAAADGRVNHDRNAR